MILMHTEFYCLSLFCCSLSWSTLTPSLIFQYIILHETWTFVIFHFHRVPIEFSIIFFSMDVGRPETFIHIATNTRIITHTHTNTYARAAHTYIHSDAFFFCVFMSRVKCAAHKLWQAEYVYSFSSHSSIRLSLTSPHMHCFAF